MPRRTRAAERGRDRRDREPDSSDRERLAPSFFRLPRRTKSATAATDRDRWSRNFQLGSIKLCLARRQKQSAKAKDREILHDTILRDVRSDFYAQISNIALIPGGAPTGLNPPFQLFRQARCAPRCSVAVMGHRFVPSCARLPECGSLTGLDRGAESAPMGTHMAPDRGSGSSHANITVCIISFIRISGAQPC